MVNFRVLVITSYLSSVNSNIAHTFVFDDELPDTIMEFGVTVAHNGIWCDSCPVLVWPTENYQRKDCLDHQTVSTNLMPLI